MIQHCDECGFDGRRRSVQELAAAIETVGDRLGALVGDHDRESLRRRPPEGGWSALEYVVHLRDAIRYHGWLVRQALTPDDERVDAVVAVAEPDPDAVAQDLRYNDADPAETLDDLSRQAARFATVVRGLDDAERQRRVMQGGTSETVTTVVTNVAHEAQHHELDVRRRLAT